MVGSAFQISLYFPVKLLTSQLSCMSMSIEKNLTLSAENNFILGENKVVFHRELQILVTFSQGLF